MSDIPNNTSDTATPAVGQTPASSIAPESAPVSTSATDPVEPAPTTAKTPLTTGEAVPAPVKEETVTNGEAAVEATPASEGVLGYKAPGFVKSLRFSKKFFWFTDEALKHEAVTNYLYNEKSDFAHHHAAWSKETGKGLLFFAKRSEEKASPAGILNLADIDQVTKEGTTEFSFKLNGHKHTFEASSDEVRASWMVDIETKAAEAKSMKEQITGSDGYKNHLLSFAKPTAAAAPLTATTQRESPVPPKKSLETKAKDALKKDSSSSSSDGEKKERRALKRQQKEEKGKSRSQSRKGTSIFGSIMGKKEEHDEKKAEKDSAKEEKGHKGVEAKVTHEPSTAIESGAAVAAAAAPAAAVLVEHKKPEDKGETTSASTADKKAKRGSIFSGLFGKRDGIVSPSTEKNENDVGPSVPAKDTSMAPVSETAPTIDEPMVHKPIDTAAVTASADTPTATTAGETAKEIVPTPFNHQATASSVSTGKGGFMGFMKRQESRTDTKKDEKAVEEPSTHGAATEGPVETAETPSTTTTADARPSVKEKRRTSLFGNLGTRKEKNPEASTESEHHDGEAKKSSSPQTPGGLFRRLSKAVRPVQEKKTAATGGTDSTPIPEARESLDAKQKKSITEDEPALTNGTTSHPPTDTEGDVVPEALTTPAREVKATA